MPIPFRRLGAVYAAAVLAVFAPALRSADDVSTSAYSVLLKNCFMCHGAAKTSGLDLRTAEPALAGGDHGRRRENDPICRFLFPGPESKGAKARPGGGRAHTDSPRVSRSDRFAAVSRRGRGIRQGSVGGCRAQAD